MLFGRVNTSKGIETVFLQAYSHQRRHSLEE